MRSSSGLVRSDGEHPDSRIDLLVLFGIALLGLLVRMLLLVKSDFIIDSDEAIVGLMAKHIADGGPWPVFYYGQHYMGSLEAILAAGAFKLIGQSGAALKLVPLIFSLFHILLVYRLARRFVGVGFSQIAALLTAVAPNGLVLWSSMARGGFIEIVTLGTLGLIYAVDIIRAERILWGKLTALGLVLGLGWWVNNQMLFYLAPLGLIFPFVFLRNFGLNASLRASFVCLAAFVIGGWPFWYQNVFGSPKLATFRVLFGSNAGGNTLEYLQGFFTTALPIILGARRFWGESDVVPYGSLAVFIVYGTAFALALGACFVGGKRGKGLSIGLLLLFSVLVPVIFASSSFGWLSLGPRYLLPLYSTLFVIVAIASQALWNTRALPFRVVAGLLPVTLLGVHYTSSYAGGIAVAGQPFVFRGDRVADSHAELYAWLAENGYRHIHTNYWIGYRVAFETNEQVTFTRHGHPRSLRMPQYETVALESKFPEVYILVPQEAGFVAHELKQFGYTYRSSWVGKYVAIDQVRPAWERGEAIPLLPQQISATTAEDKVAEMVDGDRQSRWGSGMPQRPGMAVEISFDEPEFLTGIDVDFGPYVHDAPRDLVIEGVTPDNQTHTLFTLRGTKLFRDLQSDTTSEVDPLWKITFPPQQLSQLRLVQQGSTEVFDWSIAELQVYRPSQASLARARLSAPPPATP